MELIVHKPTCTVRGRPCACEPEVFPVERAREAFDACEEAPGRLEHGRWTPPVHVDTLDTPNSQAKRHGRHKGQISN